MRAMVASALVLLLFATACAGAGPTTSAPAAQPAVASTAAPAAGAPAATAPAPPPPLTRVASSYSVVTGAVAPVWLAKDLGLWEQYGLDVDLTLISGAPNAIAALITGDAAFIQIAGDSAFNAQVRDPDIVSVLNTSAGSVHRMMVQGEVNRPEELKGKRLGVFTHGDGNYALISRALLKFGLSPERDAIWTPVGGGNMAGFVSALAAGAIDGALLTPPTDLVAERNGAKALFNYADLGLPSAGLPVFVYRRTLEAQRPLVEAYLKGVVEGARVFIADPKAGKEVLAKWTSITDTDALEWTYQRQVLRTSERPWLDLEQTRQVMETLATEQADLRGLALERVMDNSVLDGLERQGFFAGR